MKTVDQIQAEMDLLVGRRIWVHNVFANTKRSVLIVGAAALSPDDFGGPKILIEEPETGDRIWLYYHPQRLLTPLEELAACAE